MKNFIKHGSQDVEQKVDRFLVFSVFDEKAQAYSKILGVHPTVSVAIRDFTIACQNPETFYHRFPSDYALYHLGTYDEESGKITSFPEPRFVVRASEILEQFKLTKQEASNAQAGLN